MSRPGFLKVLSRTFLRDAKGLICLKKTDFRIKQLKKQNATVPLVFRQNVLKNPSKVVLLNDERQWTLDDLDKFSSRVASYFTQSGFKAGDEVALCMRSCPEYIGIWLGLAKAGLVAALINTNQRMGPLVHSVTTINAKAVIYDKTMAAAIDEVRQQLTSSGVQLHHIGDGDLPTGAVNMEKSLKSASDAFEPIKGNFSDRLLYIYTSGTTGLPKAAIIKHSRYFVTGIGVHNVMSMTPDDVLFTCLPLHHFAGGIMGSSQAVLYGNTMAIKEKFSVSNYWDECIKYKATIGQYIGELCRYLYAQPEKESEKNHSVRLMFGNGMRPNIYGQFRRRFAIKDIVEVYGTSEGNAQIINNDNTEGSCGFVSRILPQWLANLVYPVALIRCDPETGEPLRNDKGLCDRCEPGEVGQFVGVIKASDPMRAFDGYSSEESTSKKIIRDVLVKGDAAYASGDLLVMDDYGYLFFRDRTGDTFRWKGENVSTTEVESVISKEADLAACVVYSVEIPGCEGRAGMAAIEDPTSRLDQDKLNKLLESLRGHLPSYAIPVMVRVVKKLEVTSTLKLPKNVLQKQAFDIGTIEDPVYLLSKSSGAYVRLQGQLFDDLCKGKIDF